MDDGSVNWRTPNDPQTAGSQPIRAGVIAAVLWALIGLAAAWLIAQAGNPTQSGALALLAGAVALLIVGRRYKLRRFGDWIAAGVVEVLVVVGVGSAAIFIWTLATAGSGLDSPSSGPISTTRPEPSATQESPSAMDPSDVAHIVAAIDELSAVDRDAIIEWVNREGEWVAENVDAAFVENKAVGAYTDQVFAALQKMGNGELDVSDEVKAILALRQDIAALAPSAVPTGA